MSSYHNENSPAKVGVNVSVPLGTLGFITWIVFMIMDYGCHMDWIVNANNAIKVGGHFWTWFPFWLPWALFGVELIFMLIVVIIITALDR